MKMINKKKLRVIFLCIMLEQVGALAKKKTILIHYIYLKINKSVLL